MLAVRYPDMTAIRYKRLGLLQAGRHALCVLFEPGSSTTEVQINELRVAGRLAQWPRE
jgi:hypothetical protein